MIISKMHDSLAFKRALTSRELVGFNKACEQAKKELKVTDTTGIIFDFSVPTQEHDTGIGTTFSADAQEYASFLKTMCGINSIQVQPQGEVSNANRSPYSGTAFSLGAHLIDLTKLANADYANLLSRDDLNEAFLKGKAKDTQSVDYDRIFAQDGQQAMLRKAYMRFVELDKNAPIKKEFAQFQKDNAYWLEKNALFDAAAEANGTQDMRLWPYDDQYLFAKKEGNSKRIKELKTVYDKEGANVVGLSEFVQFIADKQQKESKAQFNAKGISIYGDCQIGFSQKDFWSHRSAFYPDYEFGCDIGDGKYSCWSPAIDFSKLRGDAGELLQNKFDLAFRRYDGVRIDAAWQLINPLICQPTRDRSGGDVKDSNGNKLGKPIAKQPTIPADKQYIIKNIVLNSAKKNGVAPDKILLELLGGNSWDSLDSVKGLGNTLIHITRYASDGWGRVKHYETYNPADKYQNMKPGNYVIGPGTHDDPPAIEQFSADNRKDRAKNLARDLKLNEARLSRSPKEFVAAVFAELFTTAKQFFTVSDMLGGKGINTPNTTKGNWIYRAPRNYEEEYFTKLSQGKGLNLPDALSKALKAKQTRPNAQLINLVNQLDRYSAILKEEGPMTTQEADKLYA